MIVMKRLPSSVLDCFRGNHTWTGCTTRDISSYVEVSYKCSICGDTKVFRVPACSGLNKL